MRYAIEQLKTSEYLLEKAIQQNEEFAAQYSRDLEKLPGMPLMRRELEEVRQAICELESAMARDDMRREASDD